MIEENERKTSQACKALSSEEENDREAGQQRRREWKVEMRDSRKNKRKYFKVICMNRYIEDEDVV